MKKLILLFAIVSVLTGCVSTKRLDPTVMQQMNGKSICPAFMPAQSALDVFTPGEAAGMNGGLIGAAIAASSDKLNNGRLAETYDIQDPSVEVAVQLTKKLASKYKMTEQPAVKIDSVKAKPEEVARAVSSDYILCAQTTGWTFCYFSGSWDRYRPSVGMRVRLIDAKSGEVLAQMTTVAAPDLNKEQAPSYKQLFDNDAQKMKALLQPFPAILTRKFDQKIFTATSEK